MAKFKNDKGLTLIELLITIAVLAVISAIALPIINNVVSASNSNALNQTIKDASDFINKYSKSGVVAYDGLTKTFSGYVDTDGDNTIDANEKIDTLTLDADKFAATVTGTSPSVGGSYSNGGVTGTTVTAANGGTIAPPVSTVVTYSAGYAYENKDIDIYSGYLGSTSYNPGYFRMVVGSASPLFNNFLSTWTDQQVYEVTVVTTTGSFTYEARIYLFDESNYETAQLDPLQGSWTSGGTAGSVVAPFYSSPYSSVDIDKANGKITVRIS
jgi:prepilin-type N-terminal cleavage/methylation domain-containing protein